MNGVPTEVTDGLNIANPKAETIDNWTHGKTFIQPCRFYQQQFNTLLQNLGKKSFLIGVTPTYISIKYKRVEKFYSKCPQYLFDVTFGNTR